MVKPCIQIESIVAELKRQADEKSTLSLQESDLSGEITKLEKKIRNYEKQERRLITLLRHSEITQDYVLDEVNRLKRECQTDQEELDKLKQTKAKLSYLDDAEIKLSKFCQKVQQNLGNATIQDKRLALDALDIRVTVSTQSIDIKGSIPVEITNLIPSTDVTTIAQTSASLFNCRYTFIEGKGYDLSRASRTWP